MYIHFTIFKLRIVEDCNDMPAALKLAADVMSSGEPARRIEQMRAYAEAGAAVS